MAVQKIHNGVLMDMSPEEEKAHLVNARKMAAREALKEERKRVSMQMKNENGLLRSVAECVIKVTDGEPAAIEKEKLQNMLLLMDRKEELDVRLKELI